MIDRSPPPMAPPERHQPSLRRQILSPPLPPALAVATTVPTANGGLGVDTKDRRRDLLGQRRAPRRHALARVAPLARVVAEVSSDGA
jgi:hypothetical protein